MSIAEKDLRNIFVEKNGILSQEDFEKLVKSAADMRRSLEQLLMERSFVSQRYFLQLLGDYYKSKITELKIADIDQGAVKLISESFAAKNMVVPFGKEGNSLKVAMVDPSDVQLLRSIEQAVGMKVIPHAALEKSIRRAFIFYKGNIHAILEKTVEQITIRAKGEILDKEDITVSSLLDMIINNAVLMEASDIHIEPYENEIIVRYRIDGNLRTVSSLPNTFQEGLIARLKVLASLKIDEHRVPQDGRLDIDVEGQKIDIRLSIVPSLWGEKAVMRILFKEGALFDLTSLGLLENDLEKVKKYISHPYGMILACGPTGSGKTTTLYAFLQQIGMEKIDIVNISTVEDPIEYTIPRVTQIQIHPEINLTFANGLRALLRQDPDIIMVGEIRDEETADIAVRVSLTGRLLFSTLHTNDALSAIPRLLDMGVEPYLLSSTLSLVIAQRLVRKLCMHCRESFELDQKTIEKLKSFYDYDCAISVLRKAGILGESKDPFRGLRFFRAKGCEQCDHTGYQGRTSVFEILEISDNLRSHITKRSDIVTMKEAAMKEGFKTLSIDGLAKVVLGITDLDEVMRVTL